MFFIRLIKSSSQGHETGAANVVVFCQVEDLEIRCCSWFNPSSKRQLSLLQMQASALKPLNPFALGDGNGRPAFMLQTNQQ
jgi:hypothetical protein